jgi:transcriptional regulator with XRE-family HTH domain
MVGLLMPISDRLRELRTKQGMTQEGLARAADVSVSTIVKLESSQIGDPGVLTLYKVARALGVTLDALVENGGEAEPPKKPRRRK